MVVSMFTTATIMLKHPKRDLGKWDFVELPSTGHALAVRIDDQPIALMVESVIHAPVISPAIGGGKVTMPTVMIFASLPEGERMAAAEE
jgi:hypothetical protein